MTVTRPHTRYLAVLVDRQFSRLYEVHPDRVVEHTGPSDPVERDVDNDVEIGGWDSRDEEAARRHLRRVADAIEGRLGPDDRLFLGGSAQAVDGLVRILPPHYSSQVAARLHLPMHASPAEVRDALVEAARTEEQRRTAAAVAEVCDRVGADRGVAGLEPVLRALADRSISRLALLPGFAAPGARCPACNRLEAEAGRCSWCASTTETLGDVTPALLASARAEGVVVLVADDDRLAGLGGIAAEERY